MATVHKCIDCLQRRYCNYTGRCKRCDKKHDRNIWLKNKAKGLI